MKNLLWHLEISHLRIGTS